MCIAAFLWQAHPLYQLLLILNRDEYHKRPTKPAGWWEGEEIEIVGGKDDVGGGTWLGCSKNGRIAFLTNFRETDSLPHARSRGHLPVRFLKCKQDPAEFADEIIEESHLYNGFNLILVDLCSKTMVYVTNRPKENKPCALRVMPGFHVLTNASLDSPWPKAQRLLGNFKEMMNSYGEDEVHAHDMVEKLMLDTEKADENSLPGVLPLYFEHQLSSIFINTDTPHGRYGTRSTSVVLVKAGGEVCFHERYLEEDCWKEHGITYQIQ